MSNLYFKVHALTGIALKATYNHSSLLAMDFIATSGKFVESQPEDSFGMEIFLQLEQYFKQPCFQPALDLHMDGYTVFQQKIWNHLRTIPYGATRSYGEIAKLFETSPRAVGNACRTNPWPIVIPCHRVVGKNNEGGYAGDHSGCKKGELDYMYIKRFLLNHEQSRHS